MSRTKTTQKWTLASVALIDAYTDFMLSRQAMNAKETTLDYYKYTMGVFLSWAEAHGITSPEAVTARYVREYIAELVTSGKESSTVWGHARAVKTMLRFWHKEGYIQTPVKFELPKKDKKRLSVLDAEQLKQIVKACDIRARALNWGDVDMQSGLIRVREGKGSKDRSAVAGATARRVLLAYRRTIEHHDERDPLIQAKGGKRFTGSGLLSIFRLLSKRTGIHITAHAMRMTFVILSLRIDMNLLTLQSLLGYEDLSMVKLYAQMVDDDLIREHQKHSPVDSL